MASLMIPSFDQFSLKQFIRTSGPVYSLSRAVSWRLKAVGGSPFAAATLSQNESRIEQGVWSVIIPTYNRLPILTKCLEALEDQEGYEHAGIKEYEVVVVDDGSTDGTLEYLRPSRVFPHVKIFRQEHGGMFSSVSFGT